MYYIGTRLRIYKLHCAHSNETVNHVLIRRGREPPFNTHVAIIVMDDDTNTKVFNTSIPEEVGHD